jgi:hypothetical protein
MRAGHGAPMGAEEPALEQGDDPLSDDPESVACGCGRCRTPLLRPRRQSRPIWPWSGRACPRHRRDVRRLDVALQLIASGTDHRPTELCAHHPGINPAVLGGAAVVIIRASEVVSVDSSRCGRLNTHCRTGTSGMTWSTRWTARSAILLPPQLGQTARPLHENATSRSRPQSPQRIRAKPPARTPHWRKSRNARSTNGGTPSPAAQPGRLGHERLEVILHGPVQHAAGEAWSSTSARRRNCFKCDHVPAECCRNAFTSDVPCDSAGAASGL